VGGGMGGWVGLQKLITVLGRFILTRGELRFSSLVKLKKRGEITLSLTSPEKDFFIYYEVFPSPEKEKRSTIHY
jgi:hypothetical protein